MKRRPESAALAKSHIKLRALWLTTVSGMVLLTGCSTYGGIKNTFFAERPEQKVEGARRAPMYNAQGLAALPRSAQAAPVQAPQAQVPRAEQAPQAKPVAGMNPYDSFDQNGEEVEPPAMPQPRSASIAPNTQSAMTASAMQPVATAPAPQSAPVSSPATHAPTVIKADDAHFVSGNNMNPPATGANEKDSGTFFSRLFSSNTAPKADPAKRKPIPGNPQYDSNTNLAAPVPSGPLADGNDAAPSKSAESQPVKFSDSPSEPRQPLAEMKQPEPAAKWEEPSAPAIEQSRKDDGPVANAQNSNAPIDTMPPAYPKAAAIVPQGAIPLVDAMPMDSEENASVPQPAPAAPLTSPRSEWTPPQDSVAPSSFISSAQASETQAPAESRVETQVESPAEPVAQPPLMAAASASVLTEADSSAGESKPVLMAAAEQTSEKPSAPSAPNHSADADKDDDMFKPQTNFQPKEDEGAVTVSSLADKKPKEKNFFERIFGSDDKAQAKPVDKATDSKAAPEGDGRTWLERQMGFKDTMPQAEKNQAYPNFNTVPPNPERLNEIKQSGDQPQREMETMRDQAQESKMELGSEPSGQDMKVAPKEADVNASVQQPVHEISKEAVGEPIQEPSGDATPQLLGHVSAPDTIKTDDRSVAPKVVEKPAEVVQEKAPAVSSEKAPPADLSQATQTQVGDAPVAPQLPPMPQKQSSSVMMPPAATGNAPALIAPMNMDGTPEPVAQPSAPLAAAPAMEAKPELVEPKFEPAVAPQVAAPESIPEPVPAAMAEPAPAPVAPLTPPAFSKDNTADIAPAAAASDNSAQAAGAPASTTADTNTLNSGDHSQQAAPPASTNSGLPSPQLLDKVRVLPSSRYESRRQQHSSEE